MKASKYRNNTFMCLRYTLELIEYKGTTIKPKLDKLFEQIKQEKYHAIGKNMAFSDFYEQLKKFNINDLDINTRENLYEAGKSISSLMQKLNSSNKNVSYLLIIEGNTQRSDLNLNYIKMPDVGYKLSYERSLSLVNFWQSKGLDFKKIDNCELMIVGSGYFGKSREANEDENRKFTIQITPKIGEVNIGL